MVAIGFWGITVGFTIGFIIGYKIGYEQPLDL